MTCDELRSAMSETSGRKAFDAHLAECDTCLSWSIDEVLAQTPEVTAPPLFAERVMRGIADVPVPVVSSRSATRVAVAAIAVAALAAAPMLTSFDAPRSEQDIARFGVLALSVAEAVIITGWALINSSAWIGSTRAR